MADDGSQSDQHVDDDRESVSDDDGSDNDQGEAIDGDDMPAKRARVTPSQRVAATPTIPMDVSDALVMLRVGKEKKFLAAADGRSKHGALRIWTEISAELRRTFCDRPDVPASVLTTRALGKRWAYVEKKFKVSSVRCTKIAHVQSLCVQHIRTGLPRIAKAEWGRTSTPTCLHTVEGCV
jgi:hypothetical protein